MTEKEILKRTQAMIRELAGEDPDRWWYANRYVFSRLQWDERKTKVGVKQKLLEAGDPCYACGKKFESKRDIHLHRLNGGKGYSEANCVLMHAECHRKCHASRREETLPVAMPEPALAKFSKRYEKQSFLYWWDVAPSLASALDAWEQVEFVKKDTEERCVVPVEILKRFLTSDRQTTRGQGHWGIKVLKDRPAELAFEPATRKGKWLFLPVVWLGEQED